ncbi:hypothetical protein H4I96_02938 [Botrytis cinerea]
MKIAFALFLAKVSREHMMRRNRGRAKLDRGDVCIDTLNAYR